MFIIIHTIARCIMKTIQITIDEELLQRVDQATQYQNLARSQFIRNALEAALRQIVIEELERKQAEGYARFPETADEFGAWTSEQAWEEA